METLSFRQFLDDESLISVEEITGNLFEHEIVGQYRVGYKKFRVTFHAPKNQRGWKKGDFEEDTVYVISDSPHTAKKMAQDWITNRLDPRENDEKPKRVPKSNYLRDTERRHFDMRSRVVGSFKQVAEMLGYAAERRQNTVDFIDETELEILVDALNGRAKERYLNALSEPERKGLRQLLNATKKFPQQWSGSHGAKAAALAKELTVKLWPRRDKEVDDMPDILRSGPTATPLGGTQSYRNSVYRRKLSKRDVETIMARINTYADVIKEANRLGISKADLENIVSERYEASDRVYNDKRVVFNDLYKRLRIPSSHRVFGDDHVSRYFQKRGFDWEAYATEVLPTFGLETIMMPKGYGSTYEDNKEYTDWAVDWLWSLYKAGPPRREGTSASRYKEALEMILNGHMDEKAMSRQEKNPVYYNDIPF